jgi:site-specific DNA-methyltransferase (adenine-specific)
VKPYYEDAGVTIYHGDAAEVLPQLGSRKFELVLTDPPYAIGASRGEWGATAEVAIGLHEAAKRVYSTGSLVAFTTTSGRGIEFTQGALKRQLPFNRLLIWRKDGGKSKAISPWRWDSVAVMVFGRAPETRIGESSVCETPLLKSDRHPAEVPLAVARWCYLPFDAEDIDVLDPFMGSGALLAPAVQLGRRVVGIEREEKYCEIAAQRLRVGVVSLDQELELTGS